MRKHIFVYLFLLTASAATVIAQDAGIDVPDKVKPFISNGKIALAVESGDLNGDGIKDFVLVVENANAASGEGAEDKRTLLILTADATGKLTQIKSNDKVVYCRSCGGVFGDPFAGLRLKRNGFTVDNYGGSNWRWGYSYTFNYSRIDKTWQLVRVEKETFNATNPNQVKTKIFTTKKFGKVDIANADPDKFH